jgi:hypothetical protein
VCIINTSLYIGILREREREREERKERKKERKENPSPLKKERKYFLEIEENNLK